MAKIHSQSPRIHRHAVSQSAVWDDSIRNSQQVEGPAELLLISTVPKGHRQQLCPAGWFRNSPDVVCDSMSSWKERK